MTFEIFDKEGKVVNTIISEQSFMEQNYPGMYQEVITLPSTTAEVPPVIDPFVAINVKLDKVIADLTVITTQTKPKVVP